MASKHTKNGSALNSPSHTNTRPKLIEVKSKFDAEFRRFSVDSSELTKSDDFYELVNKLHKLKDIPFLVTYTDNYGDQLPINNDDNYMKALGTVKGVLRLQIQRKGETPECGFGTLNKKKKTPISKFMGQNERTPPRKNPIAISFPEDFRRVSAIIDVDVIPETHRRVKLMKNGQDKPLGFYIRDGVSVRVTPHGLEKVPGIFISRLVPGGLAESTGLLAVNDEVLEVNGIEVTGKSLDQVTDMMVANSSNLIITVKPVNQNNTLASSKSNPHRRSGVSISSHQSHKSTHSNDSDEVRDMLKDDDEDEVTDHTQVLASSGSPHTTQNNSTHSQATTTKTSAEDDGEEMTL